MIQLSLLDQKTWDLYFRQIPASNLLQSWAYGEAKKNAESWKADRYLLSSKERHLALVQVLTKKIFHKLQLVRINRGPLFIPQDVTETEMKACYQELLKKFGPLHGQPTFFAPELQETPKSQNILADSKKWLLRRQAGFTSALLDLREDTELLRKKLAGKWRNQLNAAEKTPLSVQINSSDEQFEWLVKAYEQSMLEKKFSGISAPTLRELKKQLGPHFTLVTVSLPEEQTPFAGVFLAEHGSTATYLVGVHQSKTSSNKKLTGITNLLLWNAILHLSKKGLQHLDLGGLDEKNNPGITHFKKGLNGQEYSLLGDYFILM
ncbi:MAG: lipid II:glycine glycyltransferase FemX [Bdellovibrionales bacterium]